EFLFRALTLGFQVWSLRQMVLRRGLCFREGHLLSWLFPGRCPNEQDRHGVLAKGDLHVVARFRLWTRFRLHRGSPLSRSPSATHEFCRAMGTCSTDRGSFLNILDLFAGFACIALRQILDELRRAAAALR